MQTLLDYEALAATAERDRELYVAASPFPHIVIRDFLPPDVLAEAVKGFPSPESITDWRRADAKDDAGRIAQSHKLGYSNLLRLSPIIRSLLNELNSGPFLKYMERLTGIDHLLPDPSLTGGGVHQYLPGAVLRVHADFNRLPGYELDRRLNLLVYLNDDWQASWGGGLELWDSEMRACVKKVAPVANTCVVFSTTSNSYHGMPEPLACPEGVTRRSLAMYYYTNGRPEYERASSHSTLWQARPHEAQGS